MRQRITCCTVAALALSLACGKSNNNGGNPGNVTITGQLQAGSVTHLIGDPSTQGSELSTRTDALTGPLVGYVLYCVTFGSPPVAASGTADSTGNVSVTIAAQGVAFGCFVQDPSGGTVASLSFSASSTSGTTLTVSGNTSLGTVTVDTNSGLASASVSSGTVATTPPNTNCPLGTFVFQTGAADPACSSLASQTTATITVTPGSNGNYLVSVRHGPDNHGSQSGTYCSYGAWNGLVGTWANNTLTFGPFNGNTGGGCPNNITIAMSPDGSCHNATAAVHFTGCGTCGTASHSCDNSGPTCGSLSCDFSYSGSRQ